MLFLLPASTLPSICVAIAWSSDYEVALDKMKSGLLGKKGDEKADKKDDKKGANVAVESDATDELGLRTKLGERLYRVYKVIDSQRSEPIDVVIGVANSKYTEVVKGPLQAGDKVVVRSLLADPSKQ